MTATAVKKDIATVEQAPPLAEQSADPIIGMIERAARDPQVDIDKMERLVAMQERSIARAAEDALFGALRLAHLARFPGATDATSEEAAR